MPTSNSNLTGRIHSIEPFGTVDGPGIRMVCFFQGCPLNCKFCHNPDVAWGKSQNQIKAEKILTAYNKNRHFYRTGGVTFSGGEPLFQGEFLLECVKLLKANGVHTAIDTSLSCGYRWIEKLMPYIDLWMISIKAVSPDLHRQLTNHDNGAILNHLTKLNANKADMRLRYVIIPGLTNTRQELTKLAYFIMNLPNSVPLELLAYHTMGVKKWQELSLPYQLNDYPQAEKSDLEHAESLLLECGLKSTILY